MRKYSPLLEFTPKCICSLEGWGAAIAAVGAVAGGAIAAGGAKSAASTQANAELTAAQLQANEQQNIIGLEQPYVQGGYGALNALNQGLGIGAQNPSQQAQGVGYGSLSQPFNASYMQQYSPAYQFQLQQGQSGVLNSMSGGQGALSGSALTNLSQFNQNYANTAYNNAFNQYQTQQQNVYGRLANVAQLGQAGASQEAESGTNLAGNMGSAIAGAGAAQAAGTVGAANAIGGATSNIGSLGLLYALQNQGSANQLPYLQDPAATLPYYAQ
jgi:hypothetical protein